MGALKLTYQYNQEVLPKTPYFFLKVQGKNKPTSKNGLNCFPFGMLLPGRNSSEEAYRYGYSGMEMDDEIHESKGSSYDFGARLYNPRLGRWLSRDIYESKYSYMSSYIIVANSPLIIVDKDGNDIFIVNSDGTVMNIKNVDATDVKSEIGYYTLIGTESGKEILNKYENNSKEHVYITIGPVATQNWQASTTNLVEPIPTSAVGKDINGLTGDAAVFNGVEIQASGKSAFVVLNEDFINGTGEFENSDNSVYSKAAVLFHELKAHVEMEAAVNEAVRKFFGIKKPSSEQIKAKKDEVSHGPDFYGSHGSGYNTKNHPDTPAEKIGQELTAKKNKSGKEAEAKKLKKFN